MKASREIKVPRCFICGEPIVLWFEATDCVLLSARLGGSGFAGWLVHWNCLESAAPEMGPRLLAEYEGRLGEMAMRRIVRGRPADARRN